MKDLTTGRPLRLILFFTFPLFIGNLFQQLYNFSDTLIVGQTLGVNALAAVGSTGSLNFLIIGLSTGLTTGLSIVTAQRFGAHDFRAVRQSFAAGLLVAIGCTILLTTLTLAFINPILQMMQTPTEIYAQARQFISVIFMGMFATMTFNLLSNEIRALGDSKTPLYFLIIGTVVNVALELIFILVFHWGVKGAGLATVISQIVSCVLCIFYIYRNIPLLQLHRRDFQNVVADLPEQLKFGLPMAFQASIISLGTIILSAALNSLGTNSVAATTAASKVDQLATLPMMSFGITMATFAAQNFGAEEYERIIQGVKQSLFASVTFSIVVGCVIILGGKYVVMLFVGTHVTKVLTLSQIYFYIVGVSYWLLAILYIIRYTLQGLGQSVIPTIAGVAELVMRAFAALYLTQIWGYPGACIANPLAWFGSMVVLISSYLQAIRRLHNMNRMKEKNNAIS